MTDAPRMVHSKLEEGPPYEVRFYALESGREPVRDWLKSELNKEERTQVGADLLRVQWRWPIGMPLVRPLGDHLHELRSTLETKKEVRVFFTVTGKQIVPLHNAFKKTRKTKDEDLEIARMRLRNFRGRLKNEQSQERKQRLRREQS